MMRWRLLLEEFHFQVQYYTEIKKNQVGALLRSYSLRETKSAIEDYIPVFTSSGPTDKQDTEETLCIISKNVRRDDHPTNNSHNNPPVLTRITSTEHLCEQKPDPACIAMSAHPVAVDLPPFSVDANGVLLLLFNSYTQLYIPTSLQQRIL